MLYDVMEHLEPTQFDKLFAVGGKELVMFYADWCPFCERFKPLFESVAENPALILLVTKCMEQR